MKGPPIAVALAVLVIVACSSRVPPVATMSPTLTSSVAPATASPRQTATQPTPSRTPVSTPSLSATVGPTTASTPATTLAPIATPSGLVVDEADIARHLDALAAIAEAHGGERSPHSDGYDA